MECVIKWNGKTVNKFKNIFFPAPPFWKRMSKSYFMYFFPPNNTHSPAAWIVIICIRRHILLRYVLCNIVVMKTWSANLSRPSNEMYTYTDVLRSDDLLRLFFKRYLTIMVLCCVPSVTTHIMYYRILDALLCLNTRRKHYTPYHCDRGPIYVRVDKIGKQYRTR